MGDKQAAHELLDQLVQAYNTKDADALGRLYADDITLWSSLGTSLRGRDAMLAHVAELFELLPNEQMHPEVVVTDGDVIVVELTSTGTGNDGDAYEFHFTETLRIEDGEFTEIRTYIDPDVVEASSG